ncbi:related to alpha-aminoadipate reductase [Ustilago hordei]|uniref:Related to alpha-aminoadipate reductase n=1 Tax=Ustilago hordei TaxID=120017 RepID=I2G275_USTHO|nr:related to alpha-aminoadipate reductase [Ustilago hordei]
MTISPAQGSANLLAPFAGRWSFNALIDDLISQSYDEPCISYVKSTDPFEWQHVTGTLLDRCIRATTAYYADRIGVRRKDQPCRQIGVFSDSSFDLSVTEMALIRLGYGVVLIPPNNSVPAVVHLLKSTNSTVLVYGKGKEGAAKQVCQLLQAEMEGMKEDVVLVEVNRVEEAIASHQLPAPTKERDPYQSEVPYEQQAQEPSFTLHSSGSTGLPKPYTYSHEAYLNIIADYMPYDALCTAPLYHGFACAVAWRQIIHHRHLYIYSATIRPDLVSKAARHSTAEIIYAVPFTFKMLSEDEESLDVLRSIKLCCYSGAPCPVEVGDMLVANGVNLVAFLGATEMGQIMDSIRNFSTDKGWNVMRPSERCAPYLKFENVGTTDEGPYEMVYMKGWKALSKVNRPDGSYASGDHYSIVRNEDGSIRGYVYLGRGDDTLVHLNGEKTNPVPMEQSITSSPLLRDCLVFGAGRQCTGALIVPSEQVWQPYAGFPEEERQRGLKKQIEPLLREVNAQCPSHSRLVPEMIRFLSPEKRFPVADKGSVKRAPANSMFSGEINQLYIELDLGTSTPDEAKVSVHSKEQLRTLLKEVLERFLELELDGKESVDLTSLGVESVMDSQIRSQIHRSVRMPAPLPNTIMFQHPTLHKLTDAVLQHVRGWSQNRLAHGNRKMEQEERTYELLKELRSKLKPRNSKLAEQPHRLEKEIIVLTGATGSLGAHVVDQLRRKQTVSQIICLNRAANHQEAAKRTRDSLEARGLPPLEEGSSTEVVSLAVDLSKDNLGLSRQGYAEISSKVTCVIHNGWPVNFNMSVDSFQSVLEGSVQLMNLAGQSTGTATPRFIFSSSVSVALDYPGTVIPETSFDNLENTASMGYAQSKWIVEQTIGCIPGDADDLYWLPVDVAGLITAQLTTAQLGRDCELVHAVSDEAMPWKKALGTLAEEQNLGKTFEAVPYTEWLKRLEGSDQNPSRNPMIKLLDHFKAMQGVEGRMGKFETKRLREIFASSSVEKEIAEGLRAYKPEYLTATVATWRKSGFLE